MENGTNDVDDFISGYVRTDKASISFNGAWAQNINKNEMFIDFLGDKAGARLTYGGNYEIYDGETLEIITPEPVPDESYFWEDCAFFKAIDTNVKDRNNIKYVLESMKLLDTLYKSSDNKKEIEL